MKIETQKVDIADIHVIQNLANEIWHQHYPSILSQEQINYMLKTMYASEKLHTEISDTAYCYHIILMDAIPIGYLGMNQQEQNYFLDKFYILQQYQGKGFGKKVFEIIFSSLRYEKISLFVNRQNFKAINFYFAVGFSITEVVDNSIGEGYYMNDFVMVKLQDTKLTPLG